MMVAVLTLRCIASVGSFQLHHLLFSIFRVIIQRNISAAEDRVAVVCTPDQRSLHLAGVHGYINGRVLFV